MTVLETERLTLRPMSIDDMQDMFLIYSNENAMRYIPHDLHTSIEDTRRHFETRIAFHWSIRLKGQDRVIGAINFIDARILGMGYIIHPDFWGQGITVEACGKMLDYAFTHLNHDRIELWIDENNKASLRVAEKLGFSIKGRFPLMDRHTLSYTYVYVQGMLKSDWLPDTNTELPQDAKFYSAEPVLDVPDVVATATYYRDKLGFHLDFLYGDPPTHAGVSRGEWSGSLVSIQFSQMAQGQTLNPSAGLHIRVGENLDELFEGYRAKGVTIIDAPADKAWGFREFTIQDVNGYRLIFARYL